MTPCIGVSSKRKEFSYPFIHFPNRREKTKEQREKEKHERQLSFSSSGKYSTNEEIVCSQEGK
jgi:hypothetical protein